MAINFEVVSVECILRINVIRYCIIEFRLELLHTV